MENHSYITLHLQGKYKDQMLNMS